MAGMYGVQFAGGGGPAVAEYTPVRISSVARLAAMMSLGEM